MEPLNLGNLAEGLPSLREPLLLCCLGEIPIESGPLKILSGFDGN